MNRVGIYLCCCLCLVIVELIIIVYLATEKNHGKSVWIPVDSVSKYPCENTNDIVVWHESGLSIEDINRLYVKIKKEFRVNSVATILFDTEVEIQFLDEDDKWKSMTLPKGESMKIRFLYLQTSFSFAVKGTKPGLPNLIRFTINGKDYCDPSAGHLIKYANAEKSPKGNQWYEVTRTIAKPYLSCGRRKLETGSIKNGVTNPGDWPWHVAVYVEENGSLKYACGGTLVSHTYVLTVAQCIELNKSAGFVNFTVVLGKHNLLSSDVEKTLAVDVLRSNVHEDYLPTQLNNDIALLKLKSEVQFTDFIQPACLWHKRAINLSEDNIVGSMAGWGLTNDNVLSQPLQLVNLPMVSQRTCIESNPSIFQVLLTEKDFCAGYHNNGTSPCDGDSGGGFLIFIPDELQDGSGNVTGVWYVRGVLSKGVRNLNTNLCDENEYTVFTDENKYAEWIESHLDV